jgi:hypothetical protein
MPVQVLAMRLVRYPTSVPPSRYYLSLVSLASLAVNAWPLGFFDVGFRRTINSSAPRAPIIRTNVPTTLLFALPLG